MSTRPARSKVSDPFVYRADSESTSAPQAAKPQPAAEGSQPAPQPGEIRMYLPNDIRDLPVDMSKFGTF